MNTENRKDAELKTEESRKNATHDAKEAAADDKAMHTINPFTGSEVTITPEDLEGIEKKIEADTERD